MRRINVSISLGLLRLIPTSAIKTVLLTAVLLQAALLARAAAPPPGWSVNAANFQFNESLIIRLRYNNIPTNNNTNVVGVFAGSELRGVASPTIVNGQAYYFITAYSNTFCGENLQFRAYYAPNDQVYAVSETNVFCHNSTTGTLNQPLWLNIDPNADFPVSLNAIPADTTLRTIPFGTVNLADYLVSPDGDPVAWSVQPGANLSASVTNGVLTVNPVSSSWTGTDTVRITVTENTPNHFSATVTAYFTVLPFYAAPQFAAIPPQSIYQGGSFTNFDLDNYLTYSGPCRAFGIQSQAFSGAAANPFWPALPPGAQSMHLVVRPLFAEIQLAGTGSELAAFVNNTLVGKASPSVTGSNIYYSLTLANLATGPITFRFYDAPNQFLYEKTTTLNFAPGGNVGTVANPYLLQLAPIVPSLAADGAVQLNIVNNTWLGTLSVNYFVWDCAYPLTRRDTVIASYTVAINNNPVISSPANVAFQENTCFELYDTQTSDPNNSEGSGLTYSLVGGADAGKFAINATNGKLRWLNFTPDFEAPGDANSDNKYEVNIRVKNALNLSDTLFLTVSVTDNSYEIFAPQINGGQAVCFTGNTVLQASGGSSYLWNTGATTSSITVSTSGTFTVTVTNAYACTAIVTAAAKLKPTISATVSPNPVCTGTSVFLNATPGGGSGVYSAFAWAGPNGYAASVEDPPGFQAAPSVAGAYTVTVTDANGCTATAGQTLNVTGSSAPTVAVSANSPVCAGATITLNAAPGGGSGVYTMFKWAGPNGYVANVQNPTPFPATIPTAGTYTVTVTDNVGCTASASKVIQVNARPTIVATSNSPVCLSSTVQLFSTPSNGTGLYTSFNWSGPGGYAASVEDPAGFIATNTANGIYSVTVTDNNGCTNTANTTVVVKPLPSISAAIDGPSCVGGLLKLVSTPSGGTTPYSTFMWSGPNNFSASQEDPAAFPIVGGAYAVTVTDANGCTASSGVTATVHAPPSITAGNSGAVCAGSPLSLNSSPTGGTSPYSFNWTGPAGYTATAEDPVAFSATLNSAGLYNVTVTDFNGCTAAANTLVQVNPKPVVTAANDGPFCLAQTINLSSTPSGGSGIYSSFNWNGPNGFVSIVEDPTPFAASLAATGTYRVTVTDNAGCTGTASTFVSVSSNTLPTVIAISNSPVCTASNLTLDANPSGGSNYYSFYAWTGPNNFSSAQKTPTIASVSTANAGNYTVTVTDNRGCSASVTVMVDGPTVSISKNNISCFGAADGSATVSSTGGMPPYTYLWNNGETTATINGLSAGNYTVTLTSGSGGACTAVATVSIAEPSVLTAGIQQTTPSCNNASTGSATAKGTGGTLPYSFLWPVAAGSQTTALAINLSDGVYEITVTDASGCTATATATVVGASGATINPISNIGVKCPNTSVPLTPLSATPFNPLVSYSWTGGAVAGLANGLSTGNNPSISAFTTSLSEGIYTVTVTATLGVCTSSTTFSLQIDDATPPVLQNCPANITLNNETGQCAAPYSWQPPTATDDCGNATVTQTGGPVSGSSFAVGVPQTITYTAGDLGGNSVNCSFKVTVIDVQKPAISCPVSPQTFGTDNNLCSYKNSGLSLNATASDNCALQAGAAGLSFSTSGATTLNGTTLAGVIFQHGATTVTWTAVDQSANTATCQYTVNVIDDDVPQIISCPTNLTVSTATNGTGDCSGKVPDMIPGLTATDNCTAPNALVITQVPAANSSFGDHHGAQQVVIFTVKDAENNMSFCSAILTLADTEAPIYVNCPATISLNNDVDKCGGDIFFTPPSAADNCYGIVAVTQIAGPVPGVFLPVGQIQQIQYVSVDGAGNTATCQTQIQVLDSQKPTVICPGGVQQFGTNNNCSYIANAALNITASDNCSISGATNNFNNSGNIAGALFPLGNTVVTWTATDPAGNTRTCSYTVVVSDDDAPNISHCPPSRSVNTNVNGTGDCTGTVPGMTAELTVTDNCTAVAGLIITQSPLPGTVFGAQHNDTRSVLFTVKDAAGNVSTCQNVLTLKDNEPPTFINCPTATLVFDAEPDQCSAQVNWLIPSAQDNCGTVTVTQTAGPASGALLQATCPPAPTAITYVANDNNGNGGVICSFSVRVRDTQKPRFKANILMPGDITVECDAVPVNNVYHNTVLGPLVNNDVQDNCTSSANLVLNYNQASTQGTDPALCSYYNYKLTRTWTVTDCAANALSHTQVITVQDTQKPTAVCKNITLTLDDFGKNSILPKSLDGGSTDNCAANAYLTFTASKTNFDCSNLGANNVTLTVTDPCGNFNTCVAVVTVVEGNGKCTPEYDAQGSDPCVCLNNATTLENGQFSELIQIHGLAGQTWTLSANSGLYSIASPNPPAAPLLLPLGTVLTNGQFDGIDNNGNGQTDEQSERVYYTLRARHVEGVGYTATVTNGAQPITLSNKCYYPTPIFTNLDDPFCLNTPAFQIQVGENYGASGTVVSITVNGVATNIFNAAALGIGSYEVVVIFDAGPAQPFLVVDGVVIQGSEAAALADPGCQQKISQIVNVVGTPTAVICNDLVYVSLDADCTETLLPDDVLEGTYYCYDDYILELDKTLPLGNGPWGAPIVNASDIGHVYAYRITHAILGNICNGLIKVEDKLPPTLTCPADITVACSESTETQHTGNVLIEDCSPTNTVIDDVLTDFGECSIPRAKIVRTWIVNDAWNNQSTCSQTITITPFDFADLVFPANITVDCESSYGNPTALHPDVTGAPSINGFPIGSGGLCTASIGYTDQRLDICAGSYELLRTWVVRNTCLPLGPNNPVEHTQIIQVKDFGGPVFTCPPAVTVSTDPFQCCATAPLPDMIISEGCSQISDLQAKVTGTDSANGNIITFTVPGHLGDFAGNNYWNPDTLAIFPYTQCLPLGIYTVQYTAADHCGNTSLCSFQMTVADLIPPTAACDQWTQVDLGGDGMALVNASTFDDGSKDNCAPVEFKVRRMQANDCQSDTVFYDQVKFCCSDINDTIRVVFRVYDVDVPSGPVTLEGYEGHYNDCMVQVLVNDKIKPICIPPANTTVDCENFDPSLWAYGAATAQDNCCIDTIVTTATYTLFDTVCNRGTITRTFKAFDCAGLSSQCTQRVVVNYLQDYYVKFPNDAIVTSCDGTGIFGEPSFFGKDCELLGVSFEDQIFTVVPDACFKIERTWKIVNWCTFNPNAPLTYVPNPNPNSSSTSAQNLPGPIVSYVNAQAPWAPTVVKINPNDAVATNYSVYWSANANGYEYNQVIKITDTQDPVAENCPDSLVTYCDVTPNDPLLWNETYWWDNLIGQHDLYEGPADLSITAGDACSGANINIHYLLYLDLDQDGAMETVVNSLSTGVAGGLPWNTVFFGNINSPNFIGGTARSFDGRAVPANQKYGFALQTTVQGNKRIATVRWNTQQNQNTFVVPELPYGKHKIKWIIEDGCGNESFCEYNFEVKDCKKPSVVCLNGLSVNIMPNGMITLWASDFLKYTDDNCTPADKIKSGIRRTGAGSGFPVDGNGNPLTHVDFTCDDLGTQTVELWGLDLAGNAGYCETYVIVQDNAGTCVNDPNAAKVAGTLETEAGDGVQAGSVEISGSGNAIPSFSFATMSDSLGWYNFNGIPKSSNSTVTPLKDDNPLNGVSTYDLLLISKHILNTQPLDSPLKLIAADANHSGTVTTFDIVQLRKLILGIYTDIPNNTSWRFIDKNYVFPNPLDPFETQFPETKLIADLQSNQVSENFVAIKVGDVNGSAIPNALVAADDRTVGSLLFDVSPAPTSPTPTLPGREGERAASGISSGDGVRVGETFLVSLTPDQVVQGYQFTLNINGLELIDIAGLKTENYAVFEDALTFSVDGKDALGAISLTFKARKSGKLSEMLSVSSRITKAEAYAVFAEATAYPAFAEATAGKGKLDIALRFNVNGVSTVSGLGFELYQNQPNPFVDKTLIGFYLPLPAEASAKAGDTSAEASAKAGDTSAEASAKAGDTSAEASAKAGDQPAYAEASAGKPITLTIYDETGRQLYTRKAAFASGYNHFVVEKSQLHAAGMMYYKVETETDRATKKMLMEK